MARKTRGKQRTRSAFPSQQPWQRLVNPYSPIEVLDGEELSAIHKASMEALENIGVEFLNERALTILEKSGAIVDRDNKLVRMDRGLVLESISNAPSKFTLHARNPQRYVEIGDNHICFDSVGGPAYVSDLDHGRRAGNFDDFKKFICLIQSLDVLHMCGGIPAVPTDLDPETRHLDCIYTTITHTDKVWHTTGLGHQRMSDAIDMLCIARNQTRDEIKTEPGIFTTINCNSPRRFDGPMLDGLMEAVEHGQAVTITPFTLAGAMSPTTLAGSLVQQNIEALAGIAFSQIVSPGSPCVYGAFTSNVDMKSGAPAFGTPEYAQACLASGQLARYYGIPYRSSNTNTSNVADAQAVYESSMSLWGAIMGHSNLLHHAAGWLEGGLTASFEKTIIDAEMLQMMGAFLKPFNVTKDTLSVETISQVEPGGHFFGTKQTLELYEEAFYSPLLSDWRNFETWSDSGSQTATERANMLWKNILENYEQPPIDSATDEHLRAFVERRKKEEGQH